MRLPRVGNRVGDRPLLKLKFASVQLRKSKNWMRLRGVNFKYARNGEKVLLLTGKGMVAEATNLSKL